MITFVMGGTSMQPISWRSSDIYNKEANHSKKDQTKCIIFAISSSEVNKIIPSLADIELGVLNSKHEDKTSLVMVYYRCCWCRCLQRGASCIDWNATRTTRANPFT